jgi:hypothetical protein
MRDVTRPLLIILSLSLTGIIGCDDRDTTTGDATTQPTAGDRVAGALDKTGDVLDRAADKTGAVVGDAVDQAGDRAQEAGAAIKRETRELAAEAANGVHDLLADVTEAAVEPRGMDDLVERFGEADRTRIGQVEESGFPQLDGAINQFHEKWKARYGRDFDIEDEAAVFNFVTIEGDASNADRATVLFPARSGMSEIRVPIVREGASWRIDVRDTLAAQQIADNLTSGLKPINDGAQPLPDDITEAYRSSAQGTMAALMGERRTQ